MENRSENLSRRDLFRRTVKGAAAVGATAALGALVPAEAIASREGSRVPWGNGKYQTFPRIVGEDGVEGKILQKIDLGTLGPDVDTIFGLDFRGDLPTGALVIHQPDGEVLETRVVGIKRTDLETVQFQPAIGGDRFDVFRVSNFGGDVTLDKMARLHAKNTARRHQKVIYIGDLGLFEEQWGEGEKPFLQSIIRAQRPGKPQLGLPINEPDFVNPREFGQ